MIDPCPASTLEHRTVPNVSPTPWLPILALSFALAAATALGDEHAVTAARSAMEQGQLREAMVLLEDRLHRSPDDTAARRLLIRLYLDLGQGAGAEREIGRVRAANPPELSAAERADLRVQLGAAWLLQRAFARVLTDVVSEETDAAALKAELTAQRGEARLGLGSLDAAEPLLREAQGLDPGNARAMFGLARLAYAKGDAEAALAQLQQVLDADPGSYQGWELMGELRYLQGDLDGAERAFTFAVSRSPAPWVLHFKRAMVRIDRNDLDGAAEDIEAAGEAGGKFPGLDLAGGALALRQGDADGAATQLARYLQAVPGDRQGIFLASLVAARQGHYAQAEDLLKQFRSLSPADPAGVELQAGILLARGQAAEAERVIRPVSGHDGTARAAELLFDALLAQGRRGEALVVVEGLSRRFPREPRFALALVDGQFAVGNTLTARAEIARLLKEIPDSPQVHQAVARIQLRRGDSVAGLAQARALIANHAEVPAVQQLLGDALVATGDAAGARAAYARALELRPGFKPAVAALAKLQSQGSGSNAPGVALASPLPEDRGETVPAVPFDPADAEGDFAKLSVESLGQRLAADPKDVRTRVALARRLVKDKDRPAALAVLMAAPEGQIPRPALLRLRGELQLATGSPDQAVLSFEQLFAAYPNNPAPSYLLAIARAAQGDRRRMVADLERALQMAPGHPLTGGAVDAVFSAEPDDQARTELAARLASLAPGQPQLAFQQGRLALRRDDVGAAVGYFRTARQALPQDARYRRAFWGTLLADGRTEDAIADARAWLSGHPADLKTRTELAEVLVRQGRATEAVGEFRAIVEQRPDDPTARNNLAMVLLQTDPKAALGEAELAYAALPGRAEIADTLGAALLANGDPARALEVLAKVQDADESNPSVGYRYAQAKAATGDIEGAKRLLLALMQRGFPEQDEARALLARLQDRREGSSP